MSPNPPPGFLATPARGEGPGVLVLHAWWGLNDTIKSLCTRLADAGFVAFAPDLYHGKVADTIEGASELGKALDGNHLQAKAEVAEAARYLRERAKSNTTSGIAAIGFSLGAYYAVDLAGVHPELINAVVLFYGSGDADLASSKAHFLGHYAEQDEYEPRMYADALEAQLKRLGRPVTFYRYPGTKHWFFESDRVNEFSPVAASLAWQRTLDFLEDASRSRVT